MAPARLCNQQPSQALHSQTNQSHEHWQAARLQGRFYYRLWRGLRRVIIRRGAWMAVRGWVTGPESSGSRDDAWSA
jgi:hypothetical protein